MVETLQGEGYFTGTACDFIRTYGCPVGCYFCDTGYASPDGEYYKKQIKKHKKTIEELIAELKSDLVVISGGEPFINKNLPELCNAKRSFTGPWLTGRLEYKLALLSLSKAQLWSSCLSHESIGTPNPLLGLSTMLFGTYLYKSFLNKYLFVFLFSFQLTGSFNAHSITSFPRRGALDSNENAIVATSVFWR